MDDLTATVLAWVNDTRARYGLAPLDDLKRGRVSAWDCPIAESLKNGHEVRVDYDRHYDARANTSIVDGPMVKIDGMEVDAPIEVGQWANKYDLDHAGMGYKKDYYKENDDLYTLYTPGANN